MATQWLRRRAWLLACSSAVLLAACGGGTVESKFTPSRMVAFGDAFADLGQNGARYTINDGSQNNWTLTAANAYNRSLTTSAAGGLSFATGNARISAEPDAAGGTATPTLVEQVDAFLAAGTPTSGDLVLVSAGTSDVIVQGKAVIDGSRGEADALAAVSQAARDYGAQVRRLVNAGARHVVVVGPYNLGRSPWAIETNRQSLLQALSSRFNEQFLVAIVDLGDSVLYVDAALYFNLVTGSPGSYDLSNVNTAACTSVDAGAGIGTGSGQVNSNLCTTSTLLPGIDRSKYLFADRVYPTPRGQQLFGDFAVSRIRERW